MSRHGIDTVKQAQKAERAIERCFADIDLAVDTLHTIARSIDSETLERCVGDLRAGIGDAMFDSCLETFRDDCKQAVADWDGEEEFWSRFDLTCRLVTP